MYVRNMKAIRQYKISHTDAQVFDVTLKGPPSWAFEYLVHEEPGGIAAIDALAPRWAACLFFLRDRSLQIDTITEVHVGAFPGHYVRYVFPSNVTEVAR
ncbi:MAG: hypothetical protein RL764_981 [Pseudomonadota bacterium]|jgi:hypothetical protein